MASGPFGTETTVVPVVRSDGTIHFRVPKPLSERLCAWTSAFLWLVASAVAAVAFWWL